MTKEFILFRRNALDKLKKWAESTNRKPLVIRGARQIGKTTVVRLFSDNFVNYIELNLEKKADRLLFEQDLPVSKIVESLALKHQISFQERSLLFIDEIQNSPAAVAMLRYFFEEFPHIYVIAAGSLLESLIDKNKISFPVGRVEYFFMYPCSFQEFLTAINQEQYLPLFFKEPYPVHLHSQLLELFNRYVLIGGMPEIVARYAQTGNIADLQLLYKSLIAGYFDDIEKYAPRESLVKIIRHVIRSAPFESGKRIKFQNFGNSNYSSREVSEAIAILRKALLLDIVYPVTATALPLQPNVKKSPKLQFFDIGLTIFMSGLQSQLVTLADFSEIERGRIIENVVYQELKANSLTYGLEQLSFWVREKKQASSEIDFIYPFGNKLIPIEVKSGSAGRLRSLSVFMDLVEHNYAVRLWSAELRIDHLKTLKGKDYQLLNLPYFLVGMLDKYLAWFLPTSARS